MAEKRQQPGNNKKTGEYCINHAVYAYSTVNAFSLPVDHRWVNGLSAS